MFSPIWRINHLKLYFKLPLWSVFKRRTNTSPNTFRRKKVRDSLRNILCEINITLLSFRWFWWNRQGGGIWQVIETLWLKRWQSLRLVMLEPKQHQHSAVICDVTIKREKQWWGCNQKTKIAQYSWYEHTRVFHQKLIKKPLKCGIENFLRQKCDE